MREAPVTLLLQNSRSSCRQRGGCNLIRHDHVKAEPSGGSCAARMARSRDWELEPVARGDTLLPGLSVSVHLLPKPSQQPEQETARHGRRAAADRGSDRSVRRVGGAVPRRARARPERDVPGGLRLLRCVSFCALFISTIVCGVSCRKQSDVHKNSSMELALI